VAELGHADKLLRLHATLDAADIPHAFGGAIALAYYAQPRGTVDIDVNVFVSPSRYADLVEILRPLGVTSGPPLKQVVRDGQARVRWGRTPIDLFFSSEAIHDAMQARVRVVPFDSDRIPVLAPEHLIVAKVVFDRTKDWADIEEMLLAVPGLDLAEAEHWLDDLLGGTDPRVERLRTVVAEIRGA
jgi:hypothetical protein